MLPLYDMLAAQNGLAMEALQRQFDLTSEQTRGVVEALLPAFSTGLKHNVTDPYGMGSFLQTLAGGGHARYFDDPMSAFSAGGRAAGNDVLAQLFGSKELSRAVAAHAATATGIGQEVIKQMLPALAAMIMGGLFKQTSGQFGPGVQPNFGTAGMGGAANPIGAILAEMMRQGGMPGAGGMAGRSGQSSAGSADNPFGKMMEDMFGGGSRRAGQDEPASPSQNPFDPFGQNPFGKMFEEMMAGYQPKPAAEPEPEPQNPSGRPRTPYDDLFGDMFETGAKQRDDVQKNMETIVGEFLKGMARRR